jgi:type IV secretion system protein VirD4
MRGPNLYRTPPNPGFVGGYNWRAMFTGLLLLIVVNAAATQFVAYRFRYQAALGKPLLFLNGKPLYAPHLWAKWLYRHGSHANPQVRLPILLGALIVVVGSSVTVVVVYGMNVRRARLLSRNSEDLHGSARWASPSDIAETGLLSAKQGVYVGGWRQPGDNHLNYLRHDGPEHVLAFAPTRSGKGVGLVIPTLLAWSESAVIYDIKGENWAKTSGFRAQRGHVCFKFSPVELTGARFNPLAEIRLGTLRDVSDAQNVAQMLIYTGEEPARQEERYWQEAAASLMTGMILHACYAAHAEGRTASLTGLSFTFVRADETFRDTLAQIANHEHDPESTLAWRTPGGTRTATHPVVAEKAREMLQKEEKDFSGVLSTAKTALSLYSDPLVARNIAASDFRVDDLVNFSRPISLYLVVPPSDKIRLRPLIRLIFTTIVNRLCERMDFQGSSQVLNRHRLLFLIDEFPSLKRMQLFSDALSFMAGYGLKSYLIAQDIRQIVDEYGPNESIVSNCHVRVAFAPNQYETAELLSKMSGTKTIQKASFSFSGSRLAPIPNHMSSSVEHVERPLITPDEVMRLRPPRKIRLGRWERIISPGDMLVFVSGHYPIYGTQMLYFKDKVFAERAKLPPPKESFAIEAKSVVTQVADDRTTNVISAPEPRTNPTALSRMETAFLAELNRRHRSAEEPN